MYQSVSAACLSLFARHHSFVIISMNNQELETYQVQLSQVELALQSDQDNEDQNKLL